MLETLFCNTDVDRSTGNLRPGTMKTADLITYVRERTTGNPVTQDPDTNAALAVILGPDAAARLYTKAAREQHLERPSLAELLRALRTAPDTFDGVLTTMQTARIMAAADLARALVKEHDQPKTAIRVTSAEDAIEYVLHSLGALYDESNEHFFAVLLDIRNKVIGAPIEISRGSVSASVVDPADIVRESCIHHASRVVLIHNHPSGECDPSKEDIDTTNKITQALKYVGVRVLDHIVVGRTRQDYFSFAKAGMV
ncbi:MAG: JAB domain-containing protein [Candidatus Cryosericum sp.]